MMRTPRQVTHELRPVTAARKGYARQCRKGCAAPVTVLIVYRYKSSGGRGEHIVTHQRCATHGARWGKRHGLKEIR